MQAGIQHRQSEPAPEERLFVGYLWVIWGIFDVCDAEIFYFLPTKKLLLENKSALHYYGTRSVLSSTLPFFHWHL